MTKNRAHGRLPDGPLAGRRVLLSTVSSDSHTWNLVFLQLFLQEAGCHVSNLGPCVPDDLLIATARRERPDAIVISSVNGHGCRDGARAVRALRRDPGTRHIPVVVGGKLGIGGACDRAQADALVDAGCDAVFSDVSPVDALVASLADATRALGQPGRWA